MADKPYQYRLASLVWLVVICAVIFGTFRYMRSASAGFLLVVLLAAIFAGPIIWLFTRPNPFRGRRRQVHPVPQDPPAPLDQRLQQFMSNVAPAQTPPSSGEQTVVLPTNIEGNSPRPRGEIGQLLRRIHGTDDSNSSEATP